MTNGFSVSPGDLPDDARAIEAAGAELSRLVSPEPVDAGRSTDEIQAAVEQLVEEVGLLGSGLTSLGAALRDAARAYVAADDAVADSLLAWGPP